MVLTRIKVMRMRSLSLALCISLVNASLLRGKINSFIHDAIGQKEVTSTTFDCDVLELDAMTPPGEEELEDQFVCVTRSGNEVKTYLFDDDLEKRFGSDIPEIGTYSMSIPWSAVRGSIVDTYHEGITVHVDKQKSRKLQSSKPSPKFGEKRVLIVRVVGKDLKPTYWKSQLYDNFFADENNMVSVF